MTLEQLQHLTVDLNAQTKLPNVFFYLSVNIFVMKLYTKYKR